MPTDIVAEYDERKHLYGEYAARLAVLLSELLTESQIIVHSVTHRLKTRESLQRKLSKGGSKYQTLSDVTDIAGVRITCFFADDVDRIAEVVEREFDVDYANTLDKRKLIDPDRFGYLSLHHVLSLSRARSSLFEYRRFPALKAELQTRSVLQHAWAEIEHDLGYKSSVEIPRHVRRRFSRVAGLLELADQEFTSIRDELVAYERHLPEAIVHAPDQVLLDRASVAVFIEQEPLVRNLDHAILADTPFVIIDEDDSADVTRRLQLAGFSDIAGVKAALYDNQETLLRFARELLRIQPPARTVTFARGHSLRGLAVLIVARVFPDSELRNYIAETRIAVGFDAVKAALTAVTA